MVRGCHCPLPWSRWQPQSWQWEQRPRRDFSICGCAGATSDGYLCVYLDRIICQTCPNSQVHSNAGPVRCVNVHGGQHSQRDAVHWPMSLVLDACQASTWCYVPQTCSNEKGLLFLKHVPCISWNQLMLWKTNLTSDSNLCFFEGPSVYNYTDRNFSGLMDYQINSSVSYISFNGKKHPLHSSFIYLQHFHDNRFWR